MGQEVNTKVAQVVAGELGIDISDVRIEATNTTRIANVAPTAASTGSDINGHAAQNAAAKIKKRLALFASDLLCDNERGINSCPDYIVFKDNKAFDSRCPDLQIGFKDLIHKAYMKRVDLGAHGFYATPGLGWNADTGKGKPFLYYANGVGAAEVSLDLLTGEYSLDRVTIIHDVGQSLNPAIDLGQVLGAFVQGFGWCTGEEVIWNKDGRILTASPATYKIPGIMDIPDDIDVEFIENRRNKKGIKRSKAIGEPPLVYGEAVFFAIVDALRSYAPANADINLTMPATYEKVLLEIDRLEKLKNK
jgi:xanthine dehydrogenase large subunit